MRPSVIPDDQKLRRALPRFRSARTVTLLEVVVCEGDGTQESLSRLVTYYFTPEGEQVAVADPAPEILRGLPS